MIIEKYLELQLLMKEFLKENAGVTAIEYALVGVAVAVIVAAVFGENGDLQGALEEGMSSINDAMSN
ncbi:Flp family type IVb pilin [Vibrio scophthalmi]|uniref:Uncharacterized protein n=1 Tax=Vibrio scophthalmi TaxID=45658 RepID=A0A1E3WL31_9VIBR|nr:MULTISPECIES: Flp family type IVb pilin [Vibrio]EGU29907.1 hypothetical protein VIBRN418_19974 [Vibrio sp. N418]MCY9804006.1 Flp family type IVb pilin [Vibrio scophthalmi]ODS10435.1 hypothetical protein VSF3289_00690 [Vibrio scophthalmi]